MKRLILFVLFCCVYAMTAKFCESKTEGFTMNKIAADFKESTEWEVDAPLPNLEIFKQKFRYLGRGGQAFAFVSEDGRYVLKFFYNYCRFPRNLIQELPFFSKYCAKKKEKRDRDFRSYHLSFEELRKETGLLYLHLNKTSENLPIVTLIDPLGSLHKVSLDEMQFAVQYKVELLYPHLDALMKEGKVQEAKDALSSLLCLLEARQAKGIYDEDAKLHRNCGFSGSKVIFIDVGRFCKSSKTQTLEEMTERLRLWLKLNHPELEHHVTHALQNR